jgi:DNA-directed RNA polymerase subunit M/transcription elongation factor TFIIS
MSKFCDYCSNLLEPNYINDQKSYKCFTCHIIYKSENDDSLIRERIKESDIMIFEKILDKAIDDPATIKAYVDCIDTKCDSKLVKQVRIGNDMLLYNICIKCRKQWLN